MELECNQKPKLRTFNLFKVFQEQPAYISKPLTFHERRLVAKTRLGCLPIRLETGRYSIPRLPEEQRLCLVCKPPNQIIDIGHVGPPQPVESEVHLLFLCSAYRVERTFWFSKMTLPPDFDSLPVEIKLKAVLNDPFNVKVTAKFLTHALNLRSKLMYQN